MNPKEQNDDPNSDQGRQHDTSERVAQSLDQPDQPLPASFNSDSNTSPHFQNLPAAYGTAPKKPFPKSILVIFAVLIVGVILAAILVSGQTAKKTNSTKSKSPAASSQAKEKAVTVPTNWKSIDTTLGFSLRLPEDWDSSGTPHEVTTLNLRSNTFVVSAPDIARSDLYILVATENLTDAQGRQAFEEAVTTVNPSLEEAYRSLGIKKEDIKITTATKTLGGKQWLQVQTDLPNESLLSLYLWHKDSAITLNAAQLSKEKLNSLVNTYLYPMAASVTIKE